MKTLHKCTDYIRSAHLVSLLSIGIIVGMNSRCWNRERVILKSAIPKLRAVSILNIVMSNFFKYIKAVNLCVWHPCVHPVCVTAHDLKITWFLSVRYSAADLKPCTLKWKDVKKHAAERSESLQACSEAVQWRSWLEFSQVDILTHLENHITATSLQSQRKQSTEPSGGGFQGHSLLKYCNQVYCGENKALSGMFEREEGTFQTLRGTQVIAGTETEERRTGKPNSKDALQNTSSGSSVFDAQSAPSHGRSLTLVRSRVTRHSPKKSTRKLQILCPLPSALSLPCSTIKVCLRSWGNFAGYI